MMICVYMGIQIQEVYIPQLGSCGAKPADAFYPAGSPAPKAPEAEVRAYDRWLNAVSNQPPILQKEEIQMDQHSSIWAQHRTHTTPTWTQYNITSRPWPQSCKEPPFLDQQEPNLDQYGSLWLHIHPPTYFRHRPNIAPTWPQRDPRTVGSLQTRPEPPHFCTNKSPT